MPERSLLKDVHTKRDVKAAVVVVLYSGRLSIGRLEVVTAIADSVARGGTEGERKDR